MDVVFVVQIECGDYYCGCGGGHILGVFKTLKEADEAKDPLGYGKKVTSIDVGVVRNKEDANWPELRNYT